MNLVNKNPFVHAGLLGVFALAAALLLGLGNEVTTAPIMERQREDLIRSLAMVIPADLHDNDLLADVITVPRKSGEETKIYLARQNGRVTAVAFDAEENGYSYIHLIMGIDANGHVLGVRVLEHEETPGLGDKIEVEKDDWIRSFDGLSLGNPPPDKWYVKKDGGIFDQFSGATITPRSVVKAVREGVQFFATHKQQLLSGSKNKEANPSKGAGS